MVSTDITVGGMTCGNCTKAVEDVLGDIPGVEEVRADLEKGIATIKHDGSVAEDYLKSIIIEMGFTSD